MTWFVKEREYNQFMTIAEYIIKCFNNGELRSDRVGYIRGMGENWKFVPDRKYGPGYLVNITTSSILSVAEISDRKIDVEYNDWAVLR